MLNGQFDSFADLYEAMKQIEVKSSIRRRTFYQKDINKIIGFVGTKIKKLAKATFVTGGFFFTQFFGK